MNCCCTPLYSMNVMQQRQLLFAILLKVCHTPICSTFWGRGAIELMLISLWASSPVCDVGIKADNQHTSIYQQTHPILPCGGENVYMHSVVFAFHTCVRDSTATVVNQLETCVRYTSSRTFTVPSDAALTIC